MFRNTAIVFFAVSTLGCARSSRPPACTPGWTAAEELRSPEPGFHVYLEAPQIVGSAGNSIIWGQPAIEWHEGVRGLERSDSGTRRLFGLIRDGSGSLVRLQPPTALQTESWPRLARTADSAMHLVWLEELPASAGAPKQQRLLYAARVAERWSTPAVIYAATRINWAPGEASRLVARGQTLHLGVSSTRNGRGTYLAYLRMTDGEWSADERDEPGIPDFVSLVIGPDGKGLLAFTQSDASANRSNGSHPYTATIAADGKLGPSVQRFWSGMDGAMHVNLVNLGDRVAMVWHKQDDRGRTDSAAVVVSDDRGETWSPAQVTALPGGARSLSAEADARGAIRAVYWRRDGQIGYATWANGAWSPASTIPDAEAASFPMLSRLDDGTLMLGWGMAIRVAGGSEMPTTRIARLVPAC